MQKAKKQPKIEIQPQFPHFQYSDTLAKHMEEGGEILRKILPEEFYNLPQSQVSPWLERKLPLLKWSEASRTPDSISIYFLCSPTQEVQAEKILPDLIRKWLIPEKEVHILGFENFYFYIKGIPSKLFFIAEIKILIESDRDLNLIQEHLPLLSNELILSLNSSKYLERILDTKALSLDQKSSQIQQYLRKLAKRSPEHFDVEIFREMSTFFALSQPEFRKFRMPKHLTRVVVSHYLARKRLMHALSISPEKRHLEFRFIRSKLHFPFGVKPVLGLSIAVALTDRFESFEESHILSAAQKFLPDVKIVKGSYYFYRANHDPIKYIYLELEKKDGTPFRDIDVRLLKRELKEELKKRIEKLIPSVFMIRNEEEVMRNILLLSQELKYLSDLPQVMVNFEKQDNNELTFTVLVIRVRKKHDISMEKAFEKRKQPFRFGADRVQNVGFIRKKNPKEANVFHLSIPKDRSILRADSSVNFYLARQKIISIITDALGEIRDYNGGMILKQGELFAQFKHAFSGIAEKNQELLENFFFALNPIEAQATTPLSSLKTLFKLLLEAKEEDLLKRESCIWKGKKSRSQIYAALRVKDTSLDEFLNEELSHLENFSKSLIRTQMRFQGTTLYGFIYKSENLDAQKRFQTCIDKAVKRWVTKIINQQQLRLSFFDLPLSLDPRLGGDEMSSNIMKMLFEGLTRISVGSQPTLALAKSVDISSDQKKYAFKLRRTFWSDGTPLVAKDFEYAWKKILSPSFYTPFAFFFYPIKNAKAAKEGKVKLDAVGVRAIDDKTLVVDLENPTPEFLELIAHSLYSPIHHELDKLHPNWAQGGDETYLCNGPMKFKKNLSNGGFEFEKNPLYWNQEKVKLDQIFILKNNAETAVEMFKNKEIDWLGHPMRPWETYFDKVQEKKSQTKFLGTHWCVFNTERFPFDHLKMRKAFAYATDRELLSQLVAHTKPATTPLPLIHTLVGNKYLAKADKQLARKLFKEALSELGLTKNTFPIITLCFIKSPIRGKLAKALVKQWEDIFGISCRLEDHEFSGIFQKMVKGDFQVGTINWKSWINDAFYTLSVFRYRNNRVNFPKWVHPKFQELLDKAQQEIILEKRLEYLKNAEEILIQEYPIIPIHYEANRFTHGTNLKNAYVSDSGHVDFSQSSIVPQ